MRVKETCAYHRNYRGEIGVLVEGPDEYGRITLRMRDGSLRQFFSKDLEEEV